MKQKQNLLVFDIDGTLLDSEATHQTGFVKGLHAIGVEYVNTDWESYTHLTDSYIAKQNYEIDVNRGFSQHTLDWFQDEFFNYIKDAEVAEIPGANSFLNYIEEQTNYAMCFATGSLHKPAVHKLNKAQISYNDAVLVTSNNYLTREEIVLAAIQKAKDYYQVNTFERIISLGDGIWDVKTAKNLNLEFIGIGKGNKEKLHEIGVKHHFENFENFDKKLL